MAQFLIHQGRDGVPVGVWRSITEFYYLPTTRHKEAHGRAVVLSIGSENTWQGWIEQLASRFPGPQDQWDIYETDGTLELQEVLDEARSNTAYGD
jgi:hypothetical protein